MCRSYDRATSRRLTRVAAIRVSQRGCMQSFNVLGIGNPVIAVPPHPVTTALTPPPVLAETKAIG